MKRLQFVIICVVVFVFAGVIFLSMNKFTKKDVQGSIITEEGLFKQAQQLAGEGNLLKAKEVYERLIQENPQGKLVLKSQKMVWDLNTRILFSPMQTEDSTIYEVKPGNTLGKIAKAHNTTVELLKRSNGLKSDLIRPAMRLKVSTAVYSILVDKSQNVLILKSNDDIFKTYKISTGMNNSTPIGQYKITLKLIDPHWYTAGAVVPPGSPKNILGTRWLALSIQGYGIHGTTLPDSIGKQVTAGCVRMLNKEVEELYGIVPIGTEVTIVD